MARAALHLSVQQLADLAEVGKNTIWRFEQGAPIRGDAVERIRAAIERAGIGLLSTPDGKVGVLAPGWSGSPVPDDATIVPPT